MAGLIGFTQTATTVAMAETVTPPYLNNKPSASEITDMGHAANAFGKEMGKAGVTNAPTFDGVNINMNVGGETLQINKDKLAPTPDGKKLRYAHTAEDFEKQKDLYNDGSAMDETGGKQKDELFADSESDSPTLEGEVYALLVDMARKEKGDYSEEEFLDKTEEILGDMENVLQDLVTCDAKSALDTQSKYVHVEDLKECQQVVDKTMTCDVKHDYSVGIIEHSDGPFNLKACADNPTGCTELWIGKVGDNYWGGTCAVYEQWTQVRVRNPQAIISATFNYAKWDDYMMVYVGNPGKETLIWTGPYDWRKNPNYFPPETPGRCELSTSWVDTPEGPIPNCNSPQRCRYGGKLKEGGSMECACNPRPDCMDEDVCEFGGTPKANGTDECSCRPEPDCMKQCKYDGRPLRDGTLRCACYPNPHPKPGDKDEDVTLPWTEPDPEPEPEVGEEQPDSAPDYERTPGVDVTPFFRNAKDGELINFKIRVSVTGGGEGYGRVIIRYDPEKVVSNDLWKPKDCIDAALGIEDGMAEGSVKCTDMPEVGIDGCAWINGVNVCERHLAESPLKGISRFCRKVAVDSKFTFNKGDTGCWNVLVGFDKNGHGIYDRVCGGENLGGNLDTCTKYKEDPNCKFVSSVCTGGMTGSTTGTCYVNDVVYDCGKDVKIEDVNAETKYDCDGIACLGENCIDVDRTQSTDFAKVNAILNAMQYMAQDMECTGLDENGNPTGDQNVDCTVFGGKSGYCKIAVGGWQDCCEPVGGPGVGEYIRMIMSAQRLHSSTVALNTVIKGGEGAYDVTVLAKEMAGQYADAWGEVTTVISNGMEWVANAFGTTMDNIYAAVDYLAAPFEWFKEKVIGEITKYMKSLMTKILQSVGINIGETTGATAAETDMFQSTLNGMFGNAAGEAIGSVITFVGWVYLAYQIADLVIQLVYKCEQSEYELVSKRDTKNCHYIGSYCKDKKLGLCIVKHRVYCCYQSPLSRIINEQIKATQPELLGDLGDWGDPENPKCKGIPLGDVTKINWDLINLDEWTALLMSTGNMVTVDKVDFDHLTGKDSTLNFTGETGYATDWGIPSVDDSTDIGKQSKAAMVMAANGDAKSSTDRLNTLERIEQRLSDMDVDGLRIKGAPCISLDVGKGTLLRGGCSEMSNAEYVCRKNGPLIDCEEIAYMNSLNELLGHPWTSQDYWNQGYRCLKGEVNIDCSTLYSQDAYIKALEEYAKIIGGTTYLNRYVCLDKSGTFNQAICEHAMEQNYCSCLPGNFICQDGNKPIACSSLGVTKTPCDCMLGACKEDCPYGGTPGSMTDNPNLVCSKENCPYGNVTEGAQNCNTSTCPYGL